LWGSGQRRSGHQLDGAMEEVANKPRDPASLARRLTPQVCKE